ncbi:MAG: hypothetical protein FWB76_08240 [Oscillospiraceae bacterium]|nr:hypothetical protein [Oscillospiraceae bacterium]
MLKRLVGLGLGAVVLVLLMGCGSAESVGADANPPEVYATTEAATEYITTTEEPTTAAPREWPGVPQAYWEILDNPPFSGWLITGYALIDINNDGILELVLVAGDEPIFLFTQRDDQAYPLATRGGPVGFTIAQDGTVFSQGGRGVHFNSSNRLEAYAIELTPITSSTFNGYYGWDDEARMVIFLYRNIHGEERAVTEEERERIVRTYYWTDNPMQFDNVTWFDE